MADAQKTLLYIDKENIEEAKFMSRGFVNPGIRNRAYINALGAEIIKDYLASSGIDVENLHNLHSISRILERIDIADLQLSNIHIDVRVVFDEEQIFVPKSHFEKGILPNMYAVIKIDDEYKSAEFLGYFLPEVIDKKNENKDYYFVTAKQLLPASTFLKAVKNYNRKAGRYLTEEDILRGRELALSLSDHDISASEEKELFGLLLLSDALRESVLEFDNFETLAYNAVHEVVKIADVDALPAAGVLPVAETEISEEVADELTEEDLEIDDLEDETIEDEVVEDSLEEAPQEEDLEIPDAEDLLGDSMLDEPTETVQEVQEEEFETIEEPEVDLSADEPQVVHEVKLPKADDEMSVDDILDRTIAAIDVEDTKEPEDDKISKDGGALSAMGTVAAAGIAAAGAAATGALAAGAVEAGEAIQAAEAIGETVEAVKGVAEGLSETESAVDDLETVENVADISETLDSETVLAEPETKLAEAETPDEYETPKDLSDIDKVESIASEVQEQAFEHETVDMQEMDVVPNDLYKEEDMDTLSDINNMEATDTTKQDEFIELHGISESEVVDLPMSDYVINEDGSTPMDKYMPVDVSDDSELVEMPPLEGAIGDSLDIEDTISQTEDLLDDTLSLPQDDLALPDDLPMADASLDEGLSEEVEEPAVEEQALVDAPEGAVEGSETSEGFEDFNIEDFEQFMEEEEAAEGETQKPLTEEQEADAVGMAEDLVSAAMEEESAGVVTEASDIVEDTAEVVEDLVEEPVAEEDVLSDPFASVQEPDFTAQENLAEISHSAVPEQNSLEEQEFINMEDINRGHAAETVISEPEIETNSQNVVENSRVISGNAVTVGEIPIDINNSGDTPVDNTPLGNLYNPESKIPGESIMNNPGTMSRKTDNRSGAPALAGVFGAVIVLVIVGIIGFFASKMLNAPKENVPQPITDDTVPTSSDNGVANSQNTLSVDKNNVMNMDNNANALASTAGASAAEARKTGKATAFVDVKKLTWEVPDYISYNNNFRQYFQSIGKSLKLALVSDLLLAKDFIYSSPVKVSVTFAKDGTFKTSQIINSSGSTQIDSIVLQTVNQTLKSVKAPRSIGNDESTTAILKIYF